MIFASAKKILKIKTTNVCAKAVYF